MRRASLHDIPQLVAMMAEFYSDSPYTLNCMAERFVRSIQSECLDRMLIFGERHLEYGWASVALRSAS